MPDPESLSFYIKIGAAMVAVLACVLVIILIRHRYKQNPYVRDVRYGRMSREIRRVRRIK